MSYVCPMHPEVRSDKPGPCPKCGMALEPREITLDPETNPELHEMSQRFWAGVVLSTPLFLTAMAEMMAGHRTSVLVSGSWIPWTQLVLATPVVLWGGWPLFQRGWASLMNRHVNMFTLIALGKGAAYGYSVMGLFFPSLFPMSFRDSAVRF